MGLSMLETGQWIIFGTLIAFISFLFVRNTQVIVQSVTVSPKYQVVIPKTVREALNLRPGQKMQVIEYAGRIELIPERDIKELRGFLKGINTEFKREEDRV